MHCLLGSEHSVCTVETNRLKLYREIIFFPEVYIKHRNTLSW